MGSPSGRRRAVDHSLVPPLHPVPGFPVEGGCTPSSRYISSPASSVRRLLYPLSIALITRPRHRIRDWSLAGTQRAETLLSESLHVYSKIQEFFLDPRDFGLGMALYRAAKSPSYLVGVVRVRRGIRVLRPRYLVCSFRGALRRHPMTM